MKFFSVKKTFPSRAFALAGAALAVLAGVPAPAAFAIGSVKTVEVCGEWPLTLMSDETPREALFHAINDARSKAIQEVCGTRVSSWDSLVSSDSAQDYCGVVVTDSVGVIHKVEEIKRGWRFPVAGETPAFPRVFFRARVSVKIPDDKPDPAFTAKITGGRSLYKDGDVDSFVVHSAYSQSAYLTVFWVNSDFEAGVIFPARQWHDNKIGAYKEREIRDLLFEMSSKSAKRETGMLFFVLTKNRYPFMEKSSPGKDRERNRDHIDSWLAAIPLRERFIYVIPYAIER